MSAPSCHLFIIDPIQKLNPAWDTTIKLAFSMADLGARVFCTEAPNLFQTSHPKGVSALAEQMIFDATPASVVLKDRQLMSFEQFDAIHMRKEPPYDLSYVEALWLLTNGRHQTQIWNDPLALQQINEKLVIADFPKFSKPLMVGSDPKTLAAFALDQCGGDIVVKPLNLFGGRGVVRLSNTKTLLTDLERETEGGTLSRLVQQFEPAVLRGEVRAFAVGGKPLGWCLKRPKEGEFLANTRAGSTLHSYRPSEHEIEIVTRVATELAGRGVFIAGFDLIGGWLSEVNITCPAMLDPVRESLVGFDEIAKRFVFQA